MNRAKSLLRSIHSLYMDIAKDIKLSKKDEKKYIEIDKGKPASLNYIERIELSKLIKLIKNKKQKSQLISRIKELHIQIEKEKFNIKMYESFYPTVSRFSEYTGWRNGDDKYDINKNMTISYKGSFIFTAILLALFTISNLIYEQYSFGLNENTIVVFVLIPLIIFLFFKDNKAKVEAYQFQIHCYLSRINIYYGEEKYKEKFSNEVSSYDINYNKINLNNSYLNQ
jgi:hypothetical protein